MIEFPLPEFLQQNQMLDFLLRTLLSVICGFSLGFERKIRKHPVGIRTLVILSLSSCLLGITSITMAKHGVLTGDTTRIAAGVVTGIGFLGAGVIFRQGFNIHGLTTAAIIFMASALGLACSDGLYIPVLVTLLICFIVLTLIEHLEHRFFPLERGKLIKFEFTDDNVDENEIAAKIKACGFTITDTDYQYDSNSKRVTIFYKVFRPTDFDFTGFSKEIKTIKNLGSFYIGRGDK